MSASVVNSIMAKRKTAHQLRVDLLNQRIHSINGLADLPSHPTLPPSTILEKQCRLIVEEVCELVEACGFQIATPDDYVGRDFDLIPIKDHKLNLPEIAKEAADVSVVSMGLLSECGIADAALLEEVDVNNLAKFGPGGYMDEHKKWRKPKDHPKPDIAALLTLQGWDKPELSNETTKTDQVSVSG